MSDDAMTSPKFTPPPWRAVRSDPTEGADVWWLCAGSGNEETELGSIQGGYPRDRCEANARLTAAAPELYEALVTLLPKGWGDDDTMDHMRGVKLARMALARARGDGS